MKYPILLVLAIFASSHTFAQTSVERFLNQYGEVENINKLTLQGGLLQLFSQDLAESATKKTMNKLDKLTAIWVENYNPINPKEVRSLLNNLQREQFEPLVMVKDGSANVNFLVQENGNRITGVILLIDDDDHFLLVHLMGNLKFEDLSNVNFEINGMEYFKKLPKKRSHLKRA